MIAGGDDLYATNRGTGDLYHYEGGDTWTRIGGPADQFVANVNGVYGRSIAGVHQWTGIPGEWVEVGGVVSALYAGGNTLCAADTRLGDLRCYANSPGEWTETSPKASAFAVCDEAIYALRGDRVELGGAVLRTGVLSISCGR